MSGRLFVISAPSGTGKTTLLRKVMADIPGLAFSVSHTTRPPRAGERDGVEYYFVSHEEFADLQKQGVFLEYAEVHGNFYGTSRQAVLAQLAAGIDVILDIDVQGAAILRDDPQFDAAFIFIAPPSLTELERRLRVRGTEEEQIVRLRIANAQKELAAAGQYRYLLVNDELEQAARVLSAILVAERAGQHRNPAGKAILLNQEGEHGQTAAED